jgi:hypothetical protein
LRNVIARQHAAAAGAVSTMNGRPKLMPSFSATEGAAVSGNPPAANGTTNVTGLLGKLAASSADDKGRHNEQSDGDFGEPRRNFAVASHDGRPRFNRTLPENAASNSDSVSGSV